MYSRSDYVFMAVSCLVIIAAAIETDVFVPSFPAIQNHFGATESKVQMIVSINFLGLCVSSLFYGPLSDAFGRRPVLLAGMGIFAFASLACIFAPTLNSLLFWRFVQGLGSSAAFVVPGAMIFDKYKPEDAAKMLGWYNCTITLAIAAAPIIGSFLQINFGWRAAFMLVSGVAFFAFFAAVAYSKETLNEEARIPLHLPTIANGFVALLTNRYTASTLLIVCLMFGGYLVYISNLSLIFINYLQVNEGVYAYYQASVLLTFAVISTQCDRIITGLGMDKTRTLGKILSFIGACLLLGVAIFDAENPLTITVSMCIFTAGFAMMITIMFSDYMSEFPDLKGIASALSSSVRLLIVAVMIEISGKIFNGTIVPVASMVFIASIASVIMYFMVLHKRVRA